MVTAIALVIGAWRLHRWYKDEGRICPVCGNKHVERPSWVELPEEEMDLKFPFIVRKDALPPRPPHWLLVAGVALAVASQKFYRKAVLFCVHVLIGAAVWIVIALIFRGWPRWYVWGATRYTFTDCLPSKDQDYRRIKIVRITFKDEPLTLWHLWWTKWFHPEQFRLMPMEFKLAIDDGIKPIYHSKPTQLPKDVGQQPDLVLPLIHSVEKTAHALIESDQPE